MLAPVYWFVAVVLSSVQLFVPYEPLLLIAALGSWGLGLASLIRLVVDSNLERQ